MRLNRRSENVTNRKLVRSADFRICTKDLKSLELDDVEFECNDWIKKKRQKMMINEIPMDLKQMEKIHLFYKINYVKMLF